MIYILEALDYYKDTWMITFYFVLALALLLGLLWAFYQQFIKGEKKKQPLKENIIYNHSDDVIEYYDTDLKKKDKTTPKNNYQIKDYIYLNETNNDLKIENNENENNNIIENKNDKPKLNKNNYYKKNNNKNNYYKKNNNKYYSKKTSK